MTQKDPGKFDSCLKKKKKMATDDRLPFSMNLYPL